MAFDFVFQNSFFAVHVSDIFKASFHKFRGFLSVARTACSPTILFAVYETIGEGKLRLVYKKSVL